MNRTFSSLILAAFLISGCGNQTKAPDSKDRIMTTLPVLGLIIEPVASGFEVDVLLSDGQSPHSFQVTPSEAERLSQSRLLVFASPIIDGWAQGLTAHQEFPLWEALEDEDAHYWTDPVAVSEVLTPLSNALCDLHPEQCPLFRRNATYFSARIDSVTHVIRARLEPVKNDCFIVAQPFMTQFLDRFNIRSIGPIQPLPGHDASPRTLASMMDEARRTPCKTLMIQRAVDNRSMNALAKDLGISVTEVDHLGTHMDSYENYLEALASALLGEAQ